MQPTMERVQAWEDEGGAVLQGSPLEALWQPPKLSVGPRLGRALERGWLHMWLYNKPQWSLRHTALVGAVVVVAPLFVAGAAVPLVLLVTPVAVLALPVIAAYLVVRYLGGLG